MCNKKYMHFIDLYFGNPKISSKLVKPILFRIILLNKLIGFELLVFWLFRSDHATFPSIGINHASGRACDENGSWVYLSMTQIIAGNWVWGVHFKVEILVVIVLYVDIQAIAQWPHCVVPNCRLCYQKQTNIPIWMILIIEIFARNGNSFARVGMTVDGVLETVVLSNRYCYFGLRVVIVNSDSSELQRNN